MWVLAGPVDLYYVLKSLKKPVWFQTQSSREEFGQVSRSVIHCKHASQRTPMDALKWAREDVTLSPCLFLFHKQLLSRKEGTFCLQREVSSHGFSTTYVWSYVSHLIFLKRWLDVCQGANLTWFQRFLLALKIPMILMKVMVTFHLAPNSVQMSWLGVFWFLYIESMGFTILLMYLGVKRMLVYLSALTFILYITSF